MSRAPGWAAVYGMLLIVVPIGALTAVILWPADSLSPATVQEAGLPATLSVRTTEVTDSRQIPVRLEWDTPDGAVLLGEGGGVSSVLVGEGDEIVTGTPILTVDGVSIRGLAGDVAVTTSVGDGSPDEMQFAVSELFVAVGLLDAPSDVWNQDMRRALGEYLDLVGASASDRLDPGLLIWLPFEPFTIGNVVATVGRPLPVPGDPVLTSPPQLASVEPEASADDGSTSPGIATPSNPYVASLDGVELGPWPLEGDPPVDSLEALAAVIAPDTESTVLTLAVQQPVGLASVPSSAVLTDPDGSLCLVEPDGTTALIEPVRSIGEIIEFLPVSGVTQVVTVASEVADSC